MANIYDDENKIAYLDHPLSAEDKKVAIELGYKILDSVFAPVKVEKTEGEEAPKSRSKKG